MPTRIPRPPESQPNSVQQGFVDQSQTPAFHQQASLINTNDFLNLARYPKYNSAANDSTPAQQPISGQTLGGEDEYWVDWNAWRWRVAQTVWAPLAGALMWGCTKVAIGSLETVEKALGSEFLTALAVLENHFAWLFGGQIGSEMTRSRRHGSGGPGGKPPL